VARGEGHAKRVSLRSDPGDGHPVGAGDEIEQFEFALPEHISPLMRRGGAAMTGDGAVVADIAKGLRTGDCLRMPEQGHRLILRRGG
jgi:hypothetical protein